MPTKFAKKNVEVVVATAESLKKVTEQLTQVAAQMQQSGMKEALFPWTQRQWDCLDIVVTLANQCLAVLPAQIIAKSQNRPSRYEVMHETSQKREALKKKQKPKVVVASRGKRK